MNSWEDVLLKETVLIGHADVGGASCRALLSVEDTVVCLNLRDDHFPGQPYEPFCSYSSVDRELQSVHPLHPIQIMHCTGKEISIIAINCEIAPEESHWIVTEVFNLLKRASPKKIVFLTSVLLRDLPGDIDSMLGCLFELPVSTTSTTNRPVLPQRTKIRDALLIDFIQYSIINEVPVLFVVAPAYKCRNGRCHRSDSSATVLKQLRLLLQYEFGLTCNSNLSEELVTHWNRSLNSLMYC